MTKLDLSQPVRKLQELTRVIAEEEDSKELRRELGRDIRSVLNPVRSEVRASIRTMPSKGHVGRSLRSAVAAAVSIKLKTSGNSAGAAIKASRIKLRGFGQAPKRLNTGAWTHPVFGHGSVSQVGKEGWFDRPTQGHRDEYKDAVIEAMDAFAERIAGRV